MSLALNLNYGVVKMGNRTVTVTDDVNAESAAGRLIMSCINRDDESAVSFILQETYKRTGSHRNILFSDLVGELNNLGRITDTFSFQSSILRINEGAGFSAVTTPEKYERMKEIFDRIVNVAGLSEEYDIVTRYNNVAVFSVIRK